MIITCSNCSGKFSVKAEDIGLEGRRVRCSICRNVWFQPAPPNLSEVLESITQLYPQAGPEPEPIPEGSNLPVEYTYSRPGYLKTTFITLAAIFIFIISILGSTITRPYLNSYYNKIGLPDDTGIVLRDVFAEKDNGDEGVELLVKGRIVNESGSVRTIPALRITLMGNNKKLRIITLGSQDLQLSPGEGVNFENRIVQPPEGVDNVAMDIGNKASLAAR